MQTIRDEYKEAIIGKFRSLTLLIEFLVFEKKVLTFEDDADKLKFYFQEKFHKKMNEHLAEYERKINHGRN
jgi:hypothetical protein